MIILTVICVGAGLFWSASHASADTGGILSASHSEPSVRTTSPQSVRSKFEPAHRASGVSAAHAQTLSLGTGPVGDLTKPVGSLVGTVGDTVTKAGSTVDGTAKATGRLTTKAGNAANRTVTATVDHPVGKTVENLANSVTKAVTTTVSTTLASTVSTAVDTTVGKTIPQTVTRTLTGSVTVVSTAGTSRHATPATTPTTTSHPPTAGARVQSAQQSRARSHKPSSKPAAEPTIRRTATALPLILIGAHHAAATSAGHTQAPAAQDQVPVLSGSPLIATGGTGGGMPDPSPGQLPTPSGAVTTASSSGGAWHQQALLPALNHTMFGSLLALRGSSSLAATSASYDPGYSPD